MTALAPTEEFAALIAANLITAKLRSAEAEGKNSAEVTADLIGVAQGSAVLAGLDIPTYQRIIDRANEMIQTAVKANMMFDNMHEAARLTAMKLKGGKI